MSDEPPAMDSDGELGLEALGPIMEPSRDSAVASGSDDDEGLPLGSLFKLKGQWVAKKPKSSTPENPRVRMGSTLASFMKKLSAPKKGKDGEDSPVVTSSQLESKEKDEMEGTVGMFDSREHVSDENMDDSLSGFLKRVQSGSGTDVGSVSKKRKRKESAQGGDEEFSLKVESFALLDGGFSSEKGLIAGRQARKVRGRPAKDADDTTGELEDNLISARAGRSRSLEGATTSPLYGKQKGLVGSPRGRKPRGRPRKEVGNCGDEVSGRSFGKESLEDNSLLLPVGNSDTCQSEVRSSADETREDLVAGRRGRKPRGRPCKAVEALGDSVEGDLNQTPDDKILEERRETRYHLARKRRLGTEKPSSVCDTEVKEDMVRIEGDGSKRSSGETVEVPSLFHSLSSDHVLELKHRSETTEENGLGAHMEHVSQLSYTCNGAAEDFHPLKEEAKKLENGLKHCSSGKGGNLVSREIAISTSSPAWTDNGRGSAPTRRKSTEGITETHRANSLPSNCILEGSTVGSHCVEIQDSCCMQTNISEESAVAGFALNHSISTALEAEMPFETQVKEIRMVLVKDQLSYLCEETSHENTMHEDCLHILPKKIIGTPAAFTKESSTISEPRHSKENCLPNFDQRASLLSRSKIMGILPHNTDGLNEQYDCTSLSLSDCVKKEAGETYCGGLNELPSGDHISFMSQHTLVNMQIEKIIERDDGIPRSSGVNQSISSEIATQPAVACSPSCELPPANGKCPSKELISAVDQDLLIIKDGAETNPQTNIMHLGEASLVDTSVQSDYDSTDKLASIPRAMRNLKKRRHYDMAYEGDADWEVLIQEQSLFSNPSSIDEDQTAKPKEKNGSHSPVMGEQLPSGNITAVAAGLKACAAGPIEKINFKEVLKRKGGLQEYLDCRNFILGLWSKNVNHILCLVDCGISETPSKEESQRESLVREIYKFLDRYGYINTGIAFEKHPEYPYLHHPKTSNQSIPKGNYGRKPSSSEDEVAFVLDPSNISGNITSENINTSFEVDRTPHLLDTEASATNPPLTEDGTQIKGKEHSVCTIKFTVVKTDATMKSTVGSDNCKAWEGNMATGSYDLVSADKGFSCRDARAQENIATLDATCTAPASIVVDSLCDSSVLLEEREVPYDLCQQIETEKENVTYGEKTEVMSSCLHSVHASPTAASTCDELRRIIVVGAGPAGLTAARHLQRQGFSVIVLEARDRVGGRVYTDRSSLSVPVDLGASIITGVEADVATERGPDPSSLICTQLGLELTVLNSDCPLYDIVTGKKVPADLDEALEAEFNSLLDDMVVYVTKNGENVMRMSLEDGLEHALKSRRTDHTATDAKHSDQVKMVSDSDLMHTSQDASAGSATAICAIRSHSDGVNILSPLERRVMDWHFANLEYGCAALLKEVSLPHWNQDDVYGGFGGAHCMIKGGYSTVIESLGDGLDIQLNHVVTEIAYNMGDSDETVGQQKRITVCTSNGSVFEGDAVLITVPLGCLKANTIRFSPVLPDWKQSSIQRLGFGVLNKVVLEFPEVFWDDAVDYFGATAEETDRRGQCFMFWNVKKTVGAPVLIALVVGKAAIDGQSLCTSDHVSHALMVLRKLFGETSVPNPVASVVTNWGTDIFSRGAYSYVAIGASGEDYDILGRPVANCLFFAGEATCKEHPDTVGGAMMSGLREAVRIIDILTSGKDYITEVESMEAVQRQSESERSEVRDMTRRLEASKFSSVLPRNSSEGSHTKFVKEALLKDMFSTATTTSGRLYLAKELLRLPVETLKSFAGTREGLSTLNIWILDSLGKNATQLLRHCVRILVLVSTNLLAVRISGIGKTVKEKVCVHTSRDIRAIASQLVGMWIDVFRKEKAANRGHKLLRQTAGLAPSKMKPKDSIPGKPPQRVIHEASDSRGKLQVSSSAGSDSSSKTNHKKADKRASKIEPLTGQKRDINLVSLDSKMDNNIVMSEEEAAAFAAAEAAREAALAAAKAYASSEAEISMHELPKIPSFHKFARREQYAQMDNNERRRKCSGGIYGKQDCLSEIDSRNCRVRNWSVDFTATYGKFDSSKMPADKYVQQSYSNEIAGPLSLREHSGESGAVESRLTKAWVDTETAGSGGVKDSLAIERWQSQAMDADADFFNSMHPRDEEDSNKMVKLPPPQNQRHTEESSASQAAENKSSVEGHSRGTGHIKQGVLDFVASLLMPLYKVGKIDKEGYKSIMKKTSTKVMDQCTEAEKRMAVYDFLDFRRKIKIRAFVDKLIERHMAMNVEAKC